MDTEGNVLAAGRTIEYRHRRDFTVAKFAPDGTLLWQQTLNGTANGLMTGEIGGGGHPRQRARRRPTYEYRHRR